MQLKILFAISLLLINLYSCTTFKSVKSTESFNGTFKALYNEREFDGFFSISHSKLRLDIVNAFGFSIYGLYAQNGNVFLKNYQNGKVYSKLTFNGNNLSAYKSAILYTMKNFTKLCTNGNKNILVLSCYVINGTTIPSSIIFKDKTGKRLRINLYNVKIISLRSHK